MMHSHLKALERKHENLERAIHEEDRHASRDDRVIRQLKEAKLHVKEQIERLRLSESNDSH